MYKHQQVVAIIPARDEALAIGSVIDDIKSLRNEDETPVFDRILVCDNASADETASIAKAHGAEVVHQAQPGYGIACLTALSLIEETDIVVFIDADASLQIDEAMSLLAAIELGADIVIGARIRKWREEQSMTFAQSVGNTVASFLIRLIWQVAVSDLGPFRAVRYSALQQLDMRDRSYGWTVEMQVKAIQLGLNMVEVPVHYRQRIGRSKISGSLSGVLGAGIGIISTIFKLAFRQSRLTLQPRRRYP
jgi:glycosyltransferase involved in cell wall biosynthesis